MLYVLAGLSVLVLSEGAALWYLWSKYRTAQAESDTNGFAAAAASTRLEAAYQDLAKARAALAVQNVVEAKNDVKVVETSPGLAAAIARVNGL